MKKVETKQQALNYVSNVLQNWNEFTRQHPQFSRALEILIYGEKSINETLIGFEFTEEFFNHLISRNKIVLSVHYGFANKLDLIRWCDK